MAKQILTWQTLYHGITWMCTIAAPMLLPTACHPSQQQVACLLRLQAA
jgi:hypothetical protein